MKIVWCHVFCKIPNMERNFVTWFWLSDPLNLLVFAGWTQCTQVRRGAGHSWIPDGTSDFWSPCRFVPLSSSHLMICTIGLWTCKSTFLSGDTHSQPSPSCSVATHRFPMLDLHHTPLSNLGAHHAYHRLYHMWHYVALTYILCSYVPRSHLCLTVDLVAWYCIVRVYTHCLS